MSTTLIFLFMKVEFSTLSHHFREAFKKISIKYHEICYKRVKDSNCPYPCFERGEAEVEPGAMVTNCSVRLETRVQISAKDFQGQVGQVT